MTEPQRATDTGPAGDAPAGTAQVPPPDLFAWMIVALPAVLAVVEVLLGGLADLRTALTGAALGTNLFLASQDQQANPDLRHRHGAVLWYAAAGLLMPVYLLLRQRVLGGTLRLVGAHLGVLVVTGILLASVGL
jgi:hypothetical protein